MWNLLIEKAFKSGLCVLVVIPAGLGTIPAGMNSRNFAGIPAGNSRGKHHYSKVAEMLIKKSADLNIELNFRKYQFICFGSTFTLRKKSIQRTVNKTLTDFANLSTIYWVLKILH